MTDQPGVILTGGQQLDNQPIFRSVTQALHFSFIMMTMPATSKSATQLVIERMLEDAGFREDEDEPGSIDFAGLSALEVRGQCALILSAVNSHLPKPEADAVKARYIPAPPHHSWIAREEKMAAVRAMRDYSQPRMSMQNPNAALAVCWGFYGSKKHRQDFSTYEVARGFKLSQSMVARDSKVLHQIAKSLENQAVLRLTPYFRQKLVIE